jgi:hypothetical protein
MYIYKNIIYYSNNLNPDNTVFKYPKNSIQLSQEEKEYIDNLTMEDIIKDNINDKFKSIIKELHQLK